MGGDFNHRLFLLHLILYFSRKLFFMKAAKTVDEFIKSHPDWEKILEPLREIVLSTGLSETIKWGVPTYTFRGKNILGIGAFKSYAGLWFFQGSFLNDPNSKLINAQEGKTKALRQWRFFLEEEIEPDLVRQYIFEAIENQKQGKEIKVRKSKPLLIPHELQKALDENGELQSHFNSLSKGRQREFAEYISEAKRMDTKEVRIKKIAPLILSQTGLHDKYRPS